MVCRVYSQLLFQKCFPYWQCVAIAVMPPIWSVMLARVYRKLMCIFPSGNQIFPLLKPPSSTIYKKSSNTHIWPHFSLQSIPAVSSVTAQAERFTHLLFYTWVHDASFCGLPLHFIADDGHSCPATQRPTTSSLPYTNWHACCFNHASPVHPTPLPQNSCHL